VISLIVQTLTALAVSAGAFVLLGAKVYVVVQLVLTFVVFGCLLAVPGKFDPNDPTEPYPLRDIAITAGLAVFIGALWAALPLIVAWGVAVRRIDPSQAQAASSRSGGLRDPSDEHRTDGAS